MAMLGEIMNTTVVTVEPHFSVTDASAAMVAAGVGSAVVLQSSFLAGILTERDVLRAAASGENLHETRVSDWMTPIRSHLDRKPRPRMQRRRCCWAVSATCRWSKAARYAAW